MENKRIDIQVNHPIYLSVSESAKIGGVQAKTIRRALKRAGELDFKIVNNRYQINLSSLISYLHKNTKLKNKLYNQGLGQFILKWNVDKEPPTKINYDVIKKLKEKNKQTKNRLDS